VTEIFDGSWAFDSATPFDSLVLSPGFIVEVAFSTADPFVEPASWSDVTAYFRKGGTRRGRNHELGKTQAGVATITLDNLDRRFDPTNTSSPYYPNVVPMRQIRIRTSDGYNVYRGYVQNWGQTWGGPAPAAGGDAICQVEAADAFAVLSLYGDVDFSIYRSEVLKDEPLFYFPFGDGVGTLHTDNLGSDESIFAITSPAGPGGIAYGRASGAFSWETALDVSTPAGIGGGVPSQGLIVADLPDKSDTYNFGDAGRNTARGLTIEAWVLTDSVAAGKAYYVDFEDLGLPGDPMFEVGRNADKFAVAFRDETGADKNYVTNASVFAAGTWKHIVAVIDGGHFTTYVYVNGVLVEGFYFSGRPAANYTPAPPMYVGVGSDTATFTTRGWDGAVAHLAVYDYLLTGDRVAAHYAATYDTFAHQTPGFVIGKLLDRVGWASTRRNLGNGEPTITLTPEGNVLEQILSVGEDTEHGIVEATPDGKLTFILRSGFAQAPAATFGDGGGAEIPYADLVLAYDDQDLWTTVVATGAAGTIPVTATDAAAVTAYGPRILTDETLCDDQVCLQSDAEGLLRRYKSPAVRPTSMTLHGPRSVDQQLQRQVGDRVTVKRRPPGGGTLTVDAFIEGINHDVGPDGWPVTIFQLVPTEPTTSWLVEDAVYGLLDTTTLVGW
jgi:hypothetical protein